MKIVILVLAALAAAGSGSPRDKRSYAHAHTHDEYPVSVHTVVQPSSSLPVYEYPESTQIDTHSRTVYTVQVPITYSVTLEQPSHSRQVVYHAPPQVYHTPQVYQSPAYTPSVYQAPVYTPTVYRAPQNVYRSHSVYSPTHPWVYRRSGSSWW